MVFEATDLDLQVSFDDKLQLISSGILNDADKVLDGTVSGAYSSSAVKRLREYAFATCTNLSSVSLPNCTSIGPSAFKYCSALESVNLPSCVSFTQGNDNGYFFNKATELKSISIPKLTTIEDGTRAFSDCYILEELNAPNLASLTTSTHMFSLCRKLKKVNLAKLGGATIGSYTFANCHILTTLILGGNKLNPLGNVNAFHQSKIQNGEGYIYVPDALVESYKAATNWSAFADQIKPISELED